MNFKRKIKNWVTTIREHQSLKQARRLIIFVFGMTLLLTGICMLVLPGPAILVIPVSLAVLGTEFVWARRWLKQFKKGADKIYKYMPDWARKVRKAKSV